MYLAVLNSIGVIFALGHFYFAYKYHIKRHTFKNTLLLFSISCGMCYLWYECIKYFSPLHAAFLFNVSVVFAFVLHNAFDLARFGRKISSVVLLIYGLVGTYLYYSFYTGYELEHIIGTLIWFAVFYHYIFWMLLSIKTFEQNESKKFIKDSVVFHVVIGLLLVLNLSISNPVLNILYSMPFFYFMTLVHIAFSTIKLLGIPLKFSTIQRT